MSYTLLLYGATGYSGRLIAHEAAAAGMGRRDAPYRMLLAGRSHTALSALGSELDMDHRAFPLEDRDDVVRSLAGVNVVINAAGPFAMTGDRLAKAALLAQCHYVDINGEADVYRKLDDLGRYAAKRGLGMISGAGHTAAASDLLLEVALQALRATGDGMELGAIRIAMSKMRDFSRGSLATVLRSLREQVMVVRLRAGEGRARKIPIVWHEPIGKLERTFDFSADGEVGDRRIASAATLIDTLTAMRTTHRNESLAHLIVSYVETGTVERLGYQLSTWAAPLAALPGIRDVARLQIAALPEGPSPAERAAEGHRIVLEIEDLVHRKIIDWLWCTPNPYQFTARVVLEVARTIASGAVSGWLTPAAVLQPRKEDLNGNLGYLRDCRLYERERASVQ